jgi:hypothetical protein
MMNQGVQGEDLLPVSTSPTYRAAWASSPNDAAQLQVDGTACTVYTAEFQIAGQPKLHTDRPQHNEYLAI